MTAIAVKDGMMASDTMTAYRNTKTNEEKIIQKKGYLLGVAGNKCPPNNYIADWFFEEEDPLPSFERDTEFDLLVLTPNGKIELWNQDGLKSVIDEPFWAIGSGADVCMGAMEYGATAKEAVKAAIKWAWGVEGKVISRSL